MDLNLHSPRDCQHVTLVPLESLHYAKVAEIRILKCPTLTNYFPVVFHPGCPKFCVELCEIPRNLTKGKKIRFGEEKEQKNAKNMKGVFAKVTTGLKKSILKNATIFAFMHVLSKRPLTSKKWNQSLKKLDSKYFEPIF